MAFVGWRDRLISGTCEGITITDAENKLLASWKPRPPSKLPLDPIYSLAVDDVYGTVYACQYGEVFAFRQDGSVFPRWRAAPERLRTNPVLLAFGGSRLFAAEEAPTGPIRVFSRLGNLVCTFRCLVGSPTSITASAESLFIAQARPNMVTVHSAEDGAIHACFGLETRVRSMLLMDSGHWLRLEGRTLHVLRPDGSLRARVDLRTVFPRHGDVFLAQVAQRVLLCVRGCVRTYPIPLSLFSRAHSEKT